MHYRADTDTLALDRHLKHVRCDDLNLVITNHVAAYIILNTLLNRRLAQYRLTLFTELGNKVPNSRRRQDVHGVDLCGGAVHMEYHTMHDLPSFHDIRYTERGRGYYDKDRMILAML